MNALRTLPRRAVLAGQAALATLAALPGRAGATTVLPAGTTADAPAKAPLPARWPTATAESLQPYLGQRFRVRTETQGTVVMKLVELEPGPRDPDRPAWLRRSQAVTAVFHSPDAAALVEAGADTYQVSHPGIGRADLYLSPVPRRHGGHEIAIVLN